MADITFTYSPASGAVFNPDGFNRNMYSQASGESLMGESNGRLQAANLKSTFQIESHLVRPGQAGFARSDGRTFSAAYFSDLWTGIDKERFVPIAGACITARIPYDCTLALMSASVFLTVWRQFGPANGAFATREDAPDIQVQSFFGNNDGIVYTRREMPQTVLFDPTSTLSVAKVSTVEARTCHHLNLMHYKMAGGTAPFDQLTAGWATFGLALYIPQNLTGQVSTNTDDQMYLNVNGSGTDARPLTWYSAVQRVQCYVRNATIAQLL